MFQVPATRSVSDGCSKAPWGRVSVLIIEAQNAGEAEVGQLASLPARNVAEPAEASKESSQGPGRCCATSPTPAVRRLRGLPFARDARPASPTGLALTRTPRGIKNAWTQRVDRRTTLQDVRSSER